MVEILLGIVSDDLLMITYSGQNYAGIIAAYPATLGPYFLIDALHWHHYSVSDDFRTVSKMFTRKADQLA